MTEMQGEMSIERVGLNCRHRSEAGYKTTGID